MRFKFERATYPTAYNYKDTLGLEEITTIQEKVINFPEELNFYSDSLGKVASFEKGSVRYAEYRARIIATQKLSLGKDLISVEEDDEKVTIKYYDHSYEKDINTVEELLELSDKAGNPLIVGYNKRNVIMIYDDYLE